MAEKLIGMDPRQSIKVYPRLDQKYLKKGSLNFDLIRTKIFKYQDQPSIVVVYLIYALIAVGTGVTSVLITGIENEIAKFKARVTDQVINGMGNNMLWGWVFFTCISMGLAFIACVLVVYLAPSAAGSGTPEMITYLNGVNNS